MTKKKAPDQLKPKSKMSKESRAATEKIAPLLTTTPQPSSVIGALAGTSKKATNSALQTLMLGNKATLIKGKGWVKWDERHTILKDMQALMDNLIRNRLAAEKQSTRSAELCAA